MRSRVYPTLAETIEAHRLLIEEFGGSMEFGICDYWNPPFFVRKAVITQI